MLALSDEARRRLSVLNRQDVPKPTASPSPPILPPPTIALAAGEELATPHGPCLSIRHALATYWPQGHALVDHVAAIAVPPSHDELAAFVTAFPSGTLFLDLETCGFSGSMLFLIGLVWHDGETWWLEQLLARNYAEEQAALSALSERAAAQSVLVTFNGKSFDWPMVQDRLTLYRMSLSAPPTHCDLLHHARRKWKHLLPNCKLQTLEKFVCRRTRQDDLGGADIPGAYHQFVASGNAREMNQILLHNALDLITLVEVTAKLAIKYQ